MTVEASVRTKVGDLELAADLSVEAGELVVVVGPNGAGKTTLLRTLAGLTPLRAGRVTIDGATVEDPETGVRVGPQDRSIGVVFQDYLLFPHLSALENVAFGLRARGMTRGEARTRAGAWLDRMGLRDLAAARPAALSGGQAQRVALARALATEPRLLLLDEPLAALDAATRVVVRRELRTHLRTFAGARVLVTHDPFEAVALADRILVLEHGQVVQTGPVAEVTARPRSRYVAELVGLNLFSGTGAGDHVELEAGGELAAAGAGRGRVFAVVHPRAVALHRHRPEGTPRNVWAGDAQSLDFQGDRVRVRVAGPRPIVAEVTPAAVSELDLSDGGEVWVSIKATEVDVYPA